MLNETAEVGLYSSTYLMIFSLQYKSFFQSFQTFFHSSYYHFTLCLSEVLDSSNSLFYMPKKSKGNFSEPSMAYVNSNAKQTISLINTFDATRGLKKGKEKMLLSSMCLNKLLQYCF